MKRNSKFVHEKESKLKLERNVPKPCDTVSEVEKITDDNQNLKGDSREHLDVTAQLSADLTNPYVEESPSSPGLNSPSSSTS